MRIRGLRALSQIPASLKNVIRPPPTPKFSVALHRALTKVSLDPLGHFMNPETPCAPLSSIILTRQPSLSYHDTLARTSGGPPRIEAYVCSEYKKRHPIHHTPTLRSSNRGTGVVSRSMNAMAMELFGRPETVRIGEGH